MSIPEDAKYFSETTNTFYKDGPNGRLMYFQLCDDEWYISSYLISDVEKIGKLNKIEPDMVNHPPHYTQGEIECIDAIHSALGREQYEGYLRGACIKYMWRYNNKGGVESLNKAQWYLNKMVELYEKKKP